MIVVFGGTYDPVHYGHLRVAWEASQQLEAPVRLVPCHTPPHRIAPVAGPAQRVEMLDLAIAGQDRLVVDRLEVERGGVSYTVDTLRALRTTHGATTPIVALIGADAFAQLSTWRGWRQLFELAHLAVLTRPGTDAIADPALREEVAARRAAAPSDLRALAFGKVAAIEVTPLSISASAIRAELARGGSPRFLVPDAVLDYVATRDLYRTP